MPTLDITLFGAPRIERDGAAVTLERRKSLALLAYLAAMPGAHGRATLATLLWPESDEQSAHAGLRRALVDLRQAIGPEWLAAEGDRLALPEAPGVRVDVRAFRASLAAVARHGHGRGAVCADCLAVLSRAAEGYVGDFLTGFTLRDAPDFDAWQTLQSETLRLELAEVLEQLAGSYATMGEPVRGVAHARRWLALDPLCEPAHRCLMQLYAAAGDRRAAIQQYAACQETLRKELGIPPEPETSALYERIRAGLPAHSPAPLLSHSPAPQFSHAPPRLGAFFGREAELAQIAARLADPACRLLTIVGPGGVGKTSLALQASAELSDRFPAGVCFVPLAAVADGALVSSAVLQALKVPPRGSMAPQSQLLDHLAERRLLLVLDNFEQLLGDQASGDGSQGAADGAGLLVEILRAAPGIKLLVTSRERLNLRDEWLLPLGGLALPPVSGWSPTLGSGRSPTEPVTNDLTEADLLAEAASAPPDLEAHAATQLFLHAARRVRPDLRLDGDAAHLIARICRLADGLPLAIELTAAWVRALPLAEIARRLEAGLDLLATTQRDVPARHRSMRAAFDHSWRLLSAHERSVLRQFSVFRGGCTAEAAEAVAGATVIDLAGLVDKSWLRLEPSGRYDLHELVRQYCAERLEAEHEREVGETPDQVRDRHCAYFTDLADGRVSVFGPPRSPDLPALAPESDNLRVAWLRAIERRDPESGYRLGVFWGLYAASLGYRAAFEALEPVIRMQGAAWETVQNSDQHPRMALLLACLHWTRAWQCCALDHFPAALASARTGLEFLMQAERCEVWQGAYFWLSLAKARATMHLRGAGAAARLQRELAAYLNDPDARHWLTRPDVTLPWWQASVFRDLGFALTLLGRYAEARNACEESFALYDAGACRRLGPTGWLGFILCLEGKYVESRRHEHESLNSCRASGNRVGIGETLAFLAETEGASGEIASARDHFRRSLAIARAIDRHGLVCFDLEGLGRLELEMGRPARAAELYRESLAYAEHAGTAYDVHHTPAMVGLARAALAMGHCDQAQDDARQALRCHVYYMYDALEAVATLSQVCAVGGDILRAAEMLAFVIAHPATAHRVRQPMSRLLAEFEAELPADQFAAAVARGRARQIDDVVAELVGIAQESAPMQV